MDRSGKGPQCLGSPRSPPSSGWSCGALRRSVAVRPGPPRPNRPVRDSRGKNRRCRRRSSPDRARVRLPSAQHARSAPPATALGPDRGLRVLSRDRWDHGIVLFDGVSHQLPDVDPVETDEWLDAFDDIVDVRGRNRARYLLMRLLERARQKHVDFPATVSTPYVNTIPSDDEPEFPGDEYLERRIRAFIRWNAAVMVVRANIRSEAIGGHLSTYASSAALYEVGFNHFFRGKDDGVAGRPGLLPGPRLPGHLRPGLRRGAAQRGAARQLPVRSGRQRALLLPAPATHARLLGVPHRLDGTRPGQRDRPGPREPLPARARGLADTSASRVWCFVGDGELDEPEITRLARHGRARAPRQPDLRGQLQPAAARRAGARERQDHPGVRGALPGRWLERDQGDLGPDLGRAAGQGRRRRPAQQDELDGRRRVPEVRHRVGRLHPRALLRPGPPPAPHWSSTSPTRSCRSLPRGGHDYRKLYAAYKAATEHTGAPTAILAKTVKGWTLGPEIEARNATHQIKKMTKAQLLALRDRLFLHEEIPETALDADLPPYYRLRPTSPAARVPRRTPARARRTAATPGGPGRAPALRRPRRPSPTCWPGRASRRPPPPWPSPGCSGPSSATPASGARIVPIVADEARTFGLESLIAEVQIYAPDGQRYTPVDADLALHYAESATGQVLEEGITEAGAMATFTAAATSYATWGEPLIPCLPLLLDVRLPARPATSLWALGDVRGRGFLARVHRGADHAQRRGAPAPGRALPAPRLGDPERRRLRPCLRLRGGDRRRGRDPPDDRSGARGPLLVPHPLQRELPDARTPRRSGRGAPDPKGCRRGPLPLPASRRSGPA